MKRTIAAAAAILLLMPAGTVRAAEDIPEGFSLKYEIKDKKVTVTGCTGSESMLMIPSEIEGLPVTAVAENAFAGNTDIAICILPDSLETVGARAFSTCPNLCNLSLGKNVSYIGDYAFTACPALFDISVSKDNSTYSNIDGSLYMNGDSLLLYAGGADAKIYDKTKIIGKGAFFGKAEVVSLDIPGSVTTIDDHAFSGCLSLKSVDIPDSVAKLGKGCFMSCSSLESVSFGKSVKAVPENCFHSCNSLKSVSLTENITSIGEDAFYSCTGLGEIYIPSSVTAIGKDAMGRRYDVRSSSSENISGFVIKGKPGTAAEKYAKEYGIVFESYSVKKGDVNDDGYTDAVDASAVLAEYARISSDKAAAFTLAQKQAADWNGDGITDAVDASGILAEYARLSSGK
ncbi:MAG: leucine-rich repeat protein [Ruminococcus sp.]|nr:leucine-rich repeat protein [Ruminococcus sp.]